MDPHLQRLHDGLASLAASLSPQQWTVHPTGKWSAAEIYEHLFLSYTGTIKGMSRILESGTPQANVSSLKQRAQAFIVLEMGYMPPGREAPSAVCPRGLAVEKIASVIFGKIAEMDTMMARCAATFGVRSKVLDHPILGPFSISQWRKFHLVHGRHHMKQVRRLQMLSP